VSPNANNSIAIKLLKDDKMKSEIIELIYFGKNDTGKYISKEEEIGG